MLATPDRAETNDRNEKLVGHSIQREDRAAYGREEPEYTRRAGKLVATELDILIRASHFQMSARSFEKPALRDGAV